MSLQLNQIKELFIEECKFRNLPIERSFADFYVSLLARDSIDGINLQRVGECTVQRFLANALRRYVTPMDASVSNMRITHFFSNARDQLQLECVRKKYEENFKFKLQRLIDDILQYPENSNRKQLDEMCVKMQVFIVANYNLGCPKNHVLLKMTRQSLNSVIGRGELQNYVLKKKYHRLEYLQRLSATVCGILVYNNDGPNGEKEHMRDILADLDMAKTNTKNVLQEALQRAAECKALGYKAMTMAVQLHVSEAQFQFHCAMIKVREISSYLALFIVYERCLSEVLTAFEKTEYLISVGKNKLQCVVNKINEVLEFRAAIEAELIFPHFVYLSEVWNTLVLYFNHLAELNRIKDEIDSYVTPEMQAHYLELVQQVSTECEQKARKKPILYTIEELIERVNQRETNGNLLKAQNDTMKGFCALTVALTGGILLPATLQKKLCENLQMRFGFANMEYAKFAERNFEVFLQTFRNSVYSSVDLMLLFDIVKEVLQQPLPNVIEKVDSVEKSSNCETQTEFVLTNDLSPPNQINVTWNAWDFHRETIHMAELRKRQTHSAQTNVCYGQRDAQNQAYNARSHKV